MSSIPEIIVSYGAGGESTCVDIGIVPSLELSDEQVEEATTKLFSFLRSAFHLPFESRLTLHATESGRTLSNETFRDPSFVSNFPRYWYMTAGNGFNASNSTSVFQSLSAEDSTFPSIDYSDLSELLIMEGFSPPDLQQEDFGEDDEELGDMYPSLMELSMGQSPSQESRDDLMTIALTCDKEGDFGATFRHFTVVANIMCSDNSSSEGGDSRSESGDSRRHSRTSTHSSDSLYDTVNMSSLFVSSITPDGTADISGLQTGDIIYSINGQSVTDLTTDEIITIIEDSSKKMLLSVLPERNDNLLFLYPQYIEEHPGEYDRGLNEKIIIGDIIVRTLNLLSPLTEDGDESPEVENTPLNERRFTPNRTKKNVRSHSADYNSYNKVTTTIDSENNFHSLDVTSPLEGESSEQSLSSGIEYNSSMEDLLIGGSLADIPVEPSPVQSRKFKEHDSSLVKKDSSIDDDLANDNVRGSDSQNWYCEDSNNIQWFPKADDDENLFTVSLPVTNGSSSNDIISQSGEFPSAFGDPPSLGTKKSTKIANKLKKTFRNLTNSGHPKLEKSSSLGIVKTHSTSAIDRLKVSNSSNSNLTSRSKSTDLGKIKLKRSSLEALTKVSSDESIVKQRTSLLIKQSSCGDNPNDNINLPPLNIMETQIIPTLDFVSASPSDSNIYGKEVSGLIDNSQGSSSQYYLTPELGKNLSCESFTSSIGQRSGGRQGRSYRSQRIKLHQTKNPRSLGDSDKDIFTSSLMNPSPKTTPTITRHSRDINDHVSPLSTRKPSARRTSSWQSRPTSYKLSNDSYSSQDKIYNFSLDDSSNSFGPSHQQQAKINRDRQVYTRSPPHHHRSHSFTGDPVDDRGFRGDDDRRGFTSSVEPSLNHHRQTRPHSSGGKMSSRKAMSVLPNNQIQTSSLSYDPRGYDDHVTRMQPDTKGRKSVSNHPEKFTSVFHGPVHKKQEKDNGGKKPPDRSWRSLYAAIQKHWMVFYGSVQDALASNPLISEPPLDLHQCMVKVMPNGYKNRKNVFRLTSILDGSECVIQSENQESMMTWMRIIHNLNRTMRIKMGPPQMGMSQPHYRNSTQEDVPKNQIDKKKIYRILTPQPPSKKRSHDHKDDLSRRQQILEKLKRVKKKKEIVEDIDVPCYITFGKHIEDCPASYENKSIPLIVMVCIKELEAHWMDTEGLFRIAGPIGQVRILAQELNRGHFNLLQGHHDPHVITAVLKKFLKELPDPLVPIDKYNDFISCAQNGDAQEKRTIMKELVNELPSCHYHTLGFLMKHLTNIAVQQHVTKMSSHNLAIVFGPTVAHKAGDEVVVNEMNASIMIIKVLMENINDFFSKVDFSEFYNDNDNKSCSITNGNNKTNRNPFSRGKSDPYTSQNDMYGARSQSPRKSWDGSYLNSLSRGNLTVGSQDTFLLSCEGNSQDFRSRGPHHRRRLATSRGKLTSYIEEPQRDLSTSSSTSTLPYTLSPITPNYASSTIVSPKRKISYVNAVSKAWDPTNTATTTTTIGSSELLQSVNEDPSRTLKSNSHTEFSFSNQNISRMDRKISAGVYPASQRPSKQSLNYSDHHHRRWSAIDQNIEIFGPTSSSEWLSRSRRSENSLIKGLPESCL